MIKVFLVNDIDGEGNCYYAASTKRKAVKWIKNRQLNDYIEHKKRGWTEHELQGFKSHFENENELHPYDIQEMELDVEPE